MKTSGKVIAKNTMFLYGRLLFSMLIAIYTTRVVLESLGVVDYGIYSVVCGFVSMFSFINITLSNGIQRFFNYEVSKHGETAESSVFSVSIAIMSILCIVVLVILETLGLWYINNKMIIPVDRLFAANCIFQCAILSLLLVFMQIPFSAAIIAHEKMDYFAYVGVGDTSLKLVIAVVLPFISADSLIIYGILVLLVSILDFFLYSLYAFYKFPYLRFRLDLDRDLFKNILGFSGWNTVETIAWISQNQGVNIALNAFVGPVVNAANAIAMQINNALNGFCSSLSVAFRPQLFRSYAEGKNDKVFEMMYSMSKIMFAVYYMFIVAIILEIDYILEIWLGDNIPSYTKAFTILILLSMVPRNLIMCLSQIVHATGKMKVYQLVSAVVISVVLPVSVLILRIGMSPVWVYVFNVFMCVGLYIIDMYLLKRIILYNILDYIKGVIVPVMVSMCLIPIGPYIIQSIMSESFVRLLTVCCTSVLSTLIVCYCILLTHQQKQKVRSVIVNKINNRNK